MSTPDATCCATTSSTALAVAASNAARSMASPFSRPMMTSSSGFGRGRLPVCVVRIRSVLVFMETPDVRKRLLGGDDAPRLSDQIGRRFVDLFHQPIHLSSGHGGHFNGLLLGFG